MVLRVVGSQMEACEEENAGGDEEEEETGGEGV